MIPNIAPDSQLPPLHAPIYEPLWALCEELDLPVNMHGGTGVPNLGPYPATPTLMFLEFGWYAQRPLLRLLFSGVFERHPELTFIMTEQGNSWVPGLLAGLDWAVERMLGVPGSVEEMFGGNRATLSLKPSEYWARKCFLGAGSMVAHDCAVREATGVDRIMWGSDFPHREALTPTPVRHSATPSPESIPKRCSSCSAPTRPTRTASTSTRCRCSPARLVRESPMSRSPRSRRVPRRRLSPRSIA